MDEVIAPVPPAGPAARRRPGVRLLAAAALAAVGSMAGLALWRVTSDRRGHSIPLTPVSASPYRNTAPGARYVGGDSCRGCHPSQHASFHKSGMGRSMAAVDPTREPPDGVVDHPLSDRRYEIRRKDGQLWHREFLVAGGVSGAVLLSEYPVKFVVGSGRHSRTYLSEAEGFLVESPMTWYASRGAWGMSPGYDMPGQLGFGRPVGEGCLICHAGRTEAIGQSLHRMQVTEAAISCERCHGPGSLHVDRHSDRRGRVGDHADETDWSIVNPARLSRDLGEAVCQQCHLRPTALVVARGRSPSDYRPGLPLQDFVLPYLLDKPDSSMTVVGHVEQMHQSRCYRASKTLSCLTCHNPHDEPRAEDRTAHYRAVCLSCHQPENCTSAETRRSKRGAESDCVRCHMPSSPTEIPHLSFTHHRIGVHDAGRKPGEATAESAAGGELQPLLDVSRLAPLDRQRSLGLAYLEAATREIDPARSEPFQRRALDLLTAARAAGLNDDPALDTSLSRLRFDLRLDGVLPLAEGALKRPDLTREDRCNALFLVADAQAARGRPADAVAALQELVRLRRNPTDLLLLADCERKLGRPAAQIEALTAAARINPRLWKVHQYLAAHYRQVGDAARADWHQKRAVP